MVACWSIVVADSAAGRERAGSGLDEPADGPARASFASRSSRREPAAACRLVELRTVNQIRYVTDSNGIVAFDEPGLFNRKVFFIDHEPRLRSRQGQLRLSRQGPRGHRGRLGARS